MLQKGTRDKIEECDGIRSTDSKSVENDKFEINCHVRITTIVERVNVDFLMSNLVNFNLNVCTMELRVDQYK